MIHTLEEGLALHKLDCLPSEAIPDLALMFLADGCDVLEMAELAGSLPLEHPADVRANFERALALTGRAFPDRIAAAKALKRIYAERGSTGAWSPREAAGALLAQKG